MFKTLISTFLLCSSIGAKSVTVTPKQSNAFNSLYGTYVFRDTPLETDLTMSEPYVYDFDGYTNRPYCLFYDSNSDTLTYDWVDDIQIGYSSDSYAFRISFGRQEGYRIDYLGINDTLADCDLWVRQFQVYFNYEVYLSDDEYKLFTSLFTQSGNAYNSSYNGYFTFTSSTVQNKSTFCVLGSTLVNNQLGFLMTHDYYSSKDILCLTIDTSQPLGIGDYNLIENNQYSGKNFVLLSNVLINDTAYQRMQSFGVFSYVQDTTDYDFKDLMVSIADTPIVFLRNLFSFQLFGIELYIAFASVLTLVLIAVVIKKII